ncbi:MAG: MBL fold metallo-hydrolase [Chloroflexi bacterium]|nr:MBL fold metallo-hydrolase [Chloroflexota bacterium]
MFSLTFMGATQTVTGSKYLLECEGKKYLIDCGMYQGIKKLRERNWDKFPVDPASIDGVLFTHAHIDHTGYFPRLVSEGFSQLAHCTTPTVDLLKIMLPDSAHLQEEEAKYANKKGFSKHYPALPLYNAEDAEKACERLTPISFYMDLVLDSNISVTFRKAGHILGAAMLVMDIKCGRKHKRLVFSGDLGRKGIPLLPDPDIMEKIDYLVLESTYGNRLHSEEDRSIILKSIILEMVDAGGILLIPAFAVERTQEILYILRFLSQNHQIPNIPVYIDSPMATAVTKLFDEYIDLLDYETRLLVAGGQKLFNFPNLHFTESTEESKALNDLKGPAIIISASGMATGGRILHHLRHRLPDPKNTILLVGYQAAGTRGRSLMEGAEFLKIHGEEVPVRAAVMTVEGFSSHADYDEILEWLSHIHHKPAHVYLTHGEVDAAKSLAQKIREFYGWNVSIPDYLDYVELN